eukprot:GHVL01018756.1.p1 GENE.GHVL01018756.1~~GHVL01018756.1.p1  ORF type:complete len:454 (+),score=69.67 GHVL01018756.1:639-2000(+)
MEVVATIDQGTQSTKFTLFDSRASIIHSKQEAHEQFYPKPGWVEHNPADIWDATLRAINTVLAEMKGRNIKIKALGIANQRETALVWDKITGRPLHRAIVWSDTRTSGLVAELTEKYKDVNIFKKKVGLPIATYFSGLKFLWLIQNVPEVAAAAANGSAIFGTIDTWLIYKLTNGGSIVTDITNASRTMMMNVNTIQWSSEMCRIFKVPVVCLANIRSSSEVYGECNYYSIPDSLRGVPISGCLGDQHAACLGQGMFEKGSVKCTFGTGAFVLQNTGNEPVCNNLGLLTTPCFQLGRTEPVVWALEGSIAVAGSAISWLKDNLKLIAHPSETSDVLMTTPNTGDVYFVPAFSGLFAPRWQSHARGLLIGLSQNTRKEEVIRAVLESVAFQLYEVLASMEGMPAVLRVDGGMTSNRDFIQLVADLCGVIIEKPPSPEVTSIGAAFAAGTYHPWA